VGDLRGSARLLDDLGSASAAYKPTVCGRSNVLQRISLH